MSANLRPVAEVSAGDWIAERLRGPLGSVGSVVPRGFAGTAHRSDSSRSNGVWPGRSGPENFRRCCQDGLAPGAGLMTPVS